MTAIEFHIPSSFAPLGRRPGYFVNLLDRTLWSVKHGRELRELARVRYADHFRYGISNDGKRESLRADDQAITTARSAGPHTFTLYRNHKKSKK